MNLAVALRRYWQELLLVMLVTLPWLSLLALGILWLWQGGHVAVWAITAAALSVLAWPLAASVRRRANAEARHGLGDLAEPAAGWDAVGQRAWSEVLAIADATAPFSFLELDPLVSRARETVEAVARRFHPQARSAWSQFSFPELLLLTERLSRDVRREALRHIPGIRKIKLTHVLWAHDQTEQYGPLAQKGWRVGFGLYRLARAVLNPLQAAGQETSGFIVEKTASVLSYRLRAYATRLLVLEVGRAAIDLYSGRLALSDEEVRSAQDLDLAGSGPPARVPVRVLLVGQVSAGKSSLVNAMAQAICAAVGPLPTTGQVLEHRLELEGRPAVTLVDMPGLGEYSTEPEELLREAARADLILWTASATQPARAADRNGLKTVRNWANELARRPPSILLALTHVDQLRPAAEWAPPYDIVTPDRAKARAMRAAMDAAGGALEVPADAIVPVAAPPGREPYNIDALWARLAMEIDEAKLVQLDRLRIGRDQLSLRELAAQLGNAGRIVIGAIARR
ncbi:MAG TPA: GTPase [Xanthobacteraceae bacterium]|jgi:hypothetical protein